MINAARTTINTSYLRYFDKLLNLPTVVKFLNSTTIMGGLENIARKSSWAFRKSKLVFYQPEILDWKQMIICVLKCQGRGQGPVFSPPNRGLHLWECLKNREFAAVKFTKTLKNLINICLHMLQMTENQ